MAQFPHIRSQLLSGAVGMIKSIQDRGNTPWRPEPGRRMSSDNPPALHPHNLASHPHTPHTHEEGMRRDTGSSMVAPGSACASVSPRAQAPPQSPRLLDSYFDGVGGSGGLRAGRRRGACLGRGSLRRVPASPAGHLWRESRRRPGARPLPATPAGTQGKMSTPQIGRAHV